MRPTLAMTIFLVAVRAFHLIRGLIAALVPVPILLLTVVASGALWGTMIPLMVPTSD